MPQPDGPTTVTNSPRRMSRSTPSSATVPSGNVLATSRKCRTRVSSRWTRRRPACSGQVRSRAAPEVRGRAGRPVVRTDSPSVAPVSVVCSGGERRCGASRPGNDRRHRRPPTGCTAVVARPGRRRPRPGGAGAGDGRVEALRGDRDELRAAPSATAGTGRPMHRRAPALTASHASRVDRCPAVTSSEAASQASARPIGLNGSRRLSPPPPTVAPASSSARTAVSPARRRHGRRPGPAGRGWSAAGRRRRCRPAPPRAPSTGPPPAGGRRG